MKKQSNKKTARKAQRAPKQGSRARAAPVALGYSVTTQRAQVISRSIDSIRVKNREYITEIVAPASSTIYNPTGLPINPGMDNSFPWLAAVANQYELYRFHSLKFHYVPRASTSVGGTILMAMDYDALDTAPESKAIFLSYSGAVDGVVWSDLSLVCPPGRLNLGMPQRYTRAGVQQGLDLKTYDVGTLWYCCYGPTSAGTSQFMGDLYVEYDVELMVPQKRSVIISGSYVGSKPGQDTYVLPVSFPSGVTQKGIMPWSTPTFDESGNTVFTFLRRFEGAITFVCDLLFQDTWSGWTYGITNSSGLAEVSRLGSASGEETPDRALIDLAVKMQPGDILRVKQNSAVEWTAYAINWLAATYAMLGTHAHTAIRSGSISTEVDDRSRRASAQSRETIVGPRPGCFTASTERSCR